MDFSYEFLMFQCGNHDTKERLKFYQTFTMRLLGELKTLRETMCASCQHKCVATRFGNQLLAAPNDSMRPLKEPHVEDALPRMPESDIFLRSSGSNSLPTNEKIASDSSSLVEKPIERNQLSNESEDRKFYAERDALADTTFDVTCVYSFCHENVVHCVCFSRDGRYLAVSTGDDDKDRSIVIYEVESRRKYCELREHATQYGSYTRPLPLDLCFSSDGRYLAVVDKAKRIIIWDVPKKRIRSIFHGSYETFEVRFSPDGRRVAFDTDAELLVLNLRDNSTQRMASEGRHFDFNPDGRLIATGHVGVLAILDVRTGKAVKRWNGHGVYLHRVKFTLDGRGLLCMYKHMVEQWDVSEEPVLIRKFDIQNDSFWNHTSISPDHRLLACYDVLLDIHSGKPQYTFKGHNRYIQSVDFSAAGTYLAIGCRDGFVSLWKYARS